MALHNAQFSPCHVATSNSSPRCRYVDCWELLIHKRVSPSPSPTSNNCLFCTLLFLSTSDCNRGKKYGDRLILRGLKFHGFHGVHEEEKKSGQIFSVDIDVWLDLRRAGKTDNLEDTVSYTAIYRIVKEIVEGPAFDLLEAVADSIAASVFGKFCKVTDVRIRVGKPQIAANKEADYFGVEIFRTSPSANIK